MKEKTFSVLNIAIFFFISMSAKSRVNQFETQLSLFFPSRTGLLTDLISPDLFMNDMKLIFQINFF